MSVQPEQLLESLLSQGHIPTRRIHHGEMLSSSFVEFVALGYIQKWYEQDGSLNFSVIGNDAQLLDYYMNSVARPMVESLDGPIYDTDRYPNNSMTYRKDILGDNSPDAFSACYSAFSVYPFLVGSTFPARFVPGIDEVCKLTAHQLHCNNLDNDDSSMFRLEPDEHKIEILTNILRIREFVNAGYVKRNKLRFFGDRIQNEERLLQNIFIELDGEVINPLDSRLRHVDSHRISILTNVAVMLDPRFYRIMKNMRPDVETMWYGDKGNGDLRHLYNSGFELAQFHQHK